jgi:hypothetical protein
MALPAGVIVLPESFIPPRSVLSSRSIFGGRPVRRMGEVLPGWNEIFRRKMDDQYHRYVEKA